MSMVRSTAESGWVRSVTGLFQSFENARSQAETSRQSEVAIIGRIQTVAEQMAGRGGQHAEPHSGVHLLPPRVHAQLQDEDKESLRKLGKARRKRKARSTRARATSAEEQLGRDGAGGRDRHRTRRRSSRAEAEAEAEAEAVQAKREPSGDGAGERDRRRPRSCNARASSSGNADRDRRSTPHRSSTAEAEARADAEAKRKRSGDGAGGRFSTSMYVNMHAHPERFSTNARASSSIAAPLNPDRVPSPSVDTSSAPSGTAFASEDE